MRVRSIAVASAIAVISSVLPTASASALEPGVYVSPGSPAGKEYSLPLPAARGQGAGRSVTPGQPGPLFGVGITPPSAASHGTGAAEAGSTGSRPKSGGHRGRSASSSAATKGITGTNPVSRQELASLTHAGSAVPQVALWGGLVVLAGLAIGGLLAFLGRRQSS